MSKDYDSALKADRSSRRDWYSDADGVMLLRAIRA